MTQRWYVVHTLPHSETRVAAHLRRQEFGVYLPCYRKRRRHSRRIETVTVPLFPRYLFVAVDIAAQRWRSIQSTFGVARLICNGEEPAPVPNAILDAIKQREDDEGLVQISRERFLHGARVQITDGPFASCLGLFEGARDDERVAVLLDLLGRKVRVLIDDVALTAA